MCLLADVDEIEAEAQQLEFARNFENLRKTIQADFRPGVDNHDYDLSDSDEDVFQVSTGRPTHNMYCTSTFTDKTTRTLKKVISF